MTLPGTNISYRLRPTGGQSIHGSEAEFGTVAVANAGSIIENDNILIHFRSAQKQQFSVFSIQY